MREKLDRLKEQLFLLSPFQKLFLIGILVAIIFIIIRWRQTAKPPPPPPLQNKSSSSPPNRPLIHQAPKLAFATYENTAGLPEVPASVPVYTFKTSFTNEETQHLQTTLGLSRRKNIENSILYSSPPTEEKKALFLFNQQTGAWYYQSFAPVQPTPSRQSPEPIAREFMQNLGLFDDTITCPITYQKTTFPGMTFVECHRDWQKAGLPILSLLGTVSLADNFKLTELTVGKNYPTVLSDPTNKSLQAKEDFISRPVDFNSATFGVGEDGVIRVAMSNIRPIAAIQPHTANDLFTPEEALQRFKNHQSIFSLAIPAGQGIVDLKKVYINNTASAPIAKITDYVLVYLENPADTVQAHLTPMYLIRGKAELTSGYRVKFTEVVPALFTGQVSGESTLKLGTFDTSLTPTYPSPLPIPTTSISPVLSSTIQLSVTPTINPILCNPDFSSLKNITQTSFFGKSATIGDGAPDLTKPLTGTDVPGLYLVPDWYLRGEKEPTLIELNALIKEYGGEPILDGAVLGDKDDPIENIESENNDKVERKDDGPRYYPLSPAEILSQLYATHARCPVQISIVSPTLFVYLKKNQSVTITPDFPLTYTDPPLKKNLEWVVYNDGRSTKPKYLYYEYPKRRFAKPNEGWIVQKRHLEVFVKNVLSPILVLTSSETDRLIFELNHAVFNIDSDMLFIGPIDQKIIDHELPLRLSSKPDIIHRLHFYIERAQNGPHPNPPNLLPVERREFMILEFGAAFFDDEDSAYSLHYF